MGIPVRAALNGSLLVLLALVGCAGGSGSIATDAPTTTIDPIDAAIADGMVAKCSDGSFSDETDFEDTCKSADGIASWLSRFGECNDGRVVAMSEDADCSDHGGFKGLLPRDFEPTAQPADVALCENGTFSDNTDFDGTCSSNGGVEVWLAAFGECNDGTVIALSSDASCADHDGFKGLLAPDFEPTPNPDDVARCKNGVFSNNTDFRATCSSAGGVDEWLATYGECVDGTVIEMSKSASCSGHDGFKELLPADFSPPAPVAVDEVQAHGAAVAAGLPAAATCAYPEAIVEGTSETVTCYIYNLDGSEGTWSFLLTSDGTIVSAPTYQQTTAAPPTRATCIATQPQGQFQKDSVGYVGQCMHFWAYVFQFDANTGSCTFLGEYGDKAYTRDYQFSDAVIAVDGGEACSLLGPVVDGSYVEVWALNLGVHEYQTTLGGTNTYTGFALVDITVYR